jgi:hypothetical protein
VLVAFAVTDGRPSQISVGNETRVPPPATELMAPATKAEPNATAACGKSNPPAYNGFMALGELTKQLAQHAIGSLAEPDKAEKATPSAPPAENVCNTLLGQLQAMQKALKEDEELVVRTQSGGEGIRVLEVFVPSPQVLVLSGMDPDRNLVRVIAHVHTVQLVCKVVKTTCGATPMRIRFITPKPKPE